MPRSVSAILIIAASVISGVAVWGKWRNVLMNLRAGLRHSTPEICDRFLRGVRRWSSDGKNTSKTKHRGAKLGISADSFPRDVSMFKRRCFVKYVDNFRSRRRHQSTSGFAVLLQITKDGGASDSSPYLIRKFGRFKRLETMRMLVTALHALGTDRFLQRHG